MTDLRTVIQQIVYQLTRPVIVGEGIQELGALDAAEAVLVVPVALDWNKNIHT